MSDRKASTALSNWSAMASTSFITSQPPSSKRPSTTSPRVPSSSRPSANGAQNSIRPWDTGWAPFQLAASKTSTPG
ncbi:hypothetical protein ACN28I_35590 [Archangium gephyra]|uniref:hypothetical protein n=1 Tax=Archangium gephyra TaxID=48 RepID=UPI003B7A2D48